MNCAGPLLVGYPGMPFCCYFSVIINQLAVAGPFDHYDTESEPLRKDSLAITLQLPRTDFHRNDRRQ